MSPTDVAAFERAAEAMADLLASLPDYRVLRRLGDVDAHRRGGSSILLSGCALDVETTGLDPERDVVIELALRRFVVDTRGRVVASRRSDRWLEDPRRPLSAEVARLTGLNDRDLAGRSIPDGEAGCLILDADFVVAHNAAFDRAFCERRLPAIAGKPWVCSMRDVPWRELGYEGRVLSHLLSQMGWFYEAHRASVDVQAMLMLLDHRLEGGRTVMLEALSRAIRPTWLVEAVEAPFAAKGELKARGYRWNAATKRWEIEIPDDAFPEEVEWLRRNVYVGRRRPLFRRIDWRSRHGGR